MYFSLYPWAFETLLNALNQVSSPQIRGISHSHGGGTGYHRLWICSPIQPASLEPSVHPKVSLFLKTFISSISPAAISIVPLLKEGKDSDTSLVRVSPNLEI